LVYLYSAMKYDISILRPFSSQLFSVSCCDAVRRIARKSITRNIRAIWG